MIKSFINIFHVPELRKKLAFTCSLLLVYRLGGHVPVPGIEKDALNLSRALMKAMQFMPDEIVITNCYPYWVILDDVSKGSEIGHFRSLQMKNSLEKFIQFCMNGEFDII